MAHCHWVTHQAGCQSAAAAAARRSSRSPTHPCVHPCRPRTRPETAGAASERRATSTGRATAVRKAGRSRAGAASCTRRARAWKRPWAAAPASAHTAHDMLQQRPGAASARAPSPRRGRLAPRRRAPRDALVAPAASCAPVGSPRSRIWRHPLSCATPVRAQTREQHRRLVSDRTCGDAAWQHRSAHQNSRATIARATHRQ